MNYKLYVPANLDLEALIEDRINNYPAKYQKGVSAENLAYILHCIIKRTIQYKEKIYEGYWDGYVKLHSNNLRNIVSQYSHCVTFLLTQGIIHMKNHSQGNYSRSYCLDPQYLEDGYTKIDANKFIIKQFKKRKEKIIKAFPAVTIMDENREFLNEFLMSENLTIDVAAAKQDIDDNYETIRRGKMSEKDLKKLGEEEFQRIVAISKANFKHIIDGLAAKEFETTNDASGHRFHSPITNLPSFLRKHLRYGGERIISIDVKNSQPYFSTLLFKKEFYETQNKENEKFEGIKMYKRYKELSERINSEITSIKIPLFVNDLIESKEESTAVYLEDAFSGIFYDRFVKVPPEHNLFKKLRGNVKKAFYVSIFDEVNHKNLNSRRFYKAYPKPYELFDRIRKLEVNQNPHEIKLGYRIKQYAKIAILLQRIESYALLDVICKNINNNHPEIPLITIHDCIATTAKYVDYVYAEIESELASLIGRPPKLEVEPWGGDKEADVIALAA